MTGVTIEEERPDHLADEDVVYVLVGPDGPVDEAVDDFEDAVAELLDRTPYEIKIDDANHHEQS